MKKVYQLLSAGLALVALTACSTDDLTKQLPALTTTKTVTATIAGGDETRATILEKNVVWTSGDAFKMFDGSGNSETYTIDGEGGERTANFTTSETAISSGAEKYAAFPAANVTSLSSDVLTMTLADISYDTQTISDSALMKTVVPMWCNYAENGLSFKHLGAVLQVSFKDLPVGTTAIVAESATQNLTGTFTATLTETEPTLAYSTGGDKKVTVTLSGATTAKSDTVVLIPLPVGTYDLTVKVAVGGTETTVKSWETLTVKRAKLYTTTAVCQVSAATPSEVSAQLAGLDIKAGSVTELEITDDSSDGDGVKSSSSDQTITVPQVSGADINLLFTQPVAGTSETAPLIVTDGTTDASAAADNKLTITQPDVATENGISMEINLPKTTVTLESSGTTTTYKTIKATTASSTLIIGKGVVVEQLTVVGGNVVIDGGQVQKLGTALPEGSTLTISDGSDNGGKTVLGGDNVFYESIAKARAASQTVVTLYQDITEQYIYMTSGDLTLNLNGKVLSLDGSYNWGIYLKPASTVNLTINGDKNSKVKFAETHDMGIYATAGSDDQQTANLTLNGGTYEFGSNVLYGIETFARNGKVKITDAKLTSTRVASSGTVVYVWHGTCEVTNTTIESEGSGCLYVGGGGFYTSATDHTLKYEHATGTVSNCTFTNKSYSKPASGTYTWMASALAVSQGAELTVDGGTYTGYTAAAYVFSSGGTITLKSGTYKGTTYSFVSAKDEATYGESSGYGFGAAVLNYSTSCTVTGDTHTDGTGTINKTATATAE